jgi:hypothetical protein
MAKRIAGACFVKTDGDQLEIKGGVEISAADVTRETVMSTKGVAGFKEMPRAPSLKVTALFTEDFPLETLREGSDMTITAELANGKVFTLSGAYLVGEPTIKGEDGEIDLEFEGSKGIWQ